MTEHSTTRVPSGHGTPGNYETWWAGLTGIPGEILWAAAREDLLADLAIFGAAFNPALPLVDLGCGDGRQTRFLAAHTGRVVGVDIAPSAIARAQRAGNPGNVDYRVLDVRVAAELSALHDELGDANVYLRGVLHAVPATQRRVVAEGIATLLGSLGTLYLKELPPSVETYFADLVHQHGPPAGLDRIMALIPPGVISVDELTTLFPEDRFQLLDTGAGQLLTANTTPDGEQIIVPTLYALIRPRPRTPSKVHEPARQHQTEQLP